MSIMLFKSSISLWIFCQVVLFIFDPDTLGVAPCLCIWLPANDCTEVVLLPSARGPLVKRAQPSPPRGSFLSSLCMCVALG